MAMVQTTVAHGRANTGRNHGMTFHGTEIHGVYHHHHSLTVERHGKANDIGPGL